MRRFRRWMRAWTAALVLSGVSRALVPDGARWKTGWSSSLVAGKTGWRRETRVRSEEVGAAKETDTKKKARWTGLTPAGPYGRETRRTLLRELIEGEMWALEQVQGAIFVHVPVRSVVVRLSYGGLLLYGAVAPTEECLELLGSLIELYGEVKDVVLPTVATEHKLFAAAMAQKLPAATLWIAPSQFSFPINLPIDVLGFPVARTRLLVDNALVDFACDLTFERLGPFYSAPGKSPASFEEIVFYHKKTGTLLCCDLFASIPHEPPFVLELNDARCFDFHGRSDANTVTSKLDGWKKICLFALYFQSGPLSVLNEPDGTLSQAVGFFKSAFPTPNAFNSTKWRDFFAWSWPDQGLVDASFDALSCQGALLVPPILAVAILNRRPADVRAFLDALDSKCQPITTVLPLHFDAPVPASLSDIADALNSAGLLSDSFKPSSSSSSSSLLSRPKKFSFFGGLSSSASFKRRRRLQPLPDKDLAFLRRVEASLVDAGAIEPLPPGTPRPL